MLQAAEMLLAHVVLPLRRGPRIAARIGARDAATTCVTKANGCAMNSARFSLDPVKYMNGPKMTGSMLQRRPNDGVATSRGELGVNRLVMEQR